jgi:uncharacterized protein (TIGR00645 family)
MERYIEAMLLGARWVLLPLYVALLASVLAVFVVVGRELWHLATMAMTAPETEILLVLLSLLDLVLVANLLVMVAVSSYESFVSRIQTEEGDSKPEYLGKMDSGNVKVKVAMSIVMISAIHLLRAFMYETGTERMIVLGATHLVFVVSTVLIAWIDITGRKKA